MKWGDKLGKEAIRLNSEGLGGTVVLTIQKGELGFSMAPYSLSKLNGIKDFHRFVDRRFYNPDGYSVTEEGRRYLAEIAPEIPEHNYGLA
jgi:hypothetical protein